MKYNTNKIILLFILLFDMMKTLPYLRRARFHVRKSCKYLYNALKEKSAVGLRKFLITGTSGIGKSRFLVYILIQVLREDVTVRGEAEKFCVWPLTAFAVFNAGKVY